MNDLIGQELIGRYRVLSLLGRGGMGTVYRAHDPVLNREVAVKVISYTSDQPHDGNAFVERFQKEAQITARLNHPGIVQIYDFGEKDSQLCIVMELVLGGTLDQMMRQMRHMQQWISLAEAIEVVRQIALALEYAHRQGVLHRDIKPTNIMLKELPLDNLPYRPVITDFGIAKIIEDGLGTQVGHGSIAEETSGTPAYMSPEQAMAEKVDARSDVYSLGIVFFELAVGQLPYPIRNMPEAIRYHVREPLPSPRSIRPDLPEAVEAVIVRALAKEPSQRYQSAGEFATALQNLVVTLPQVSASSNVNEADSLLAVSHYMKADPQGRSVAPAQEMIDQIMIHRPGQDPIYHTISETLITIGRGPDNTIVLDDDRISRRHARLELVGNDWRITDLDSRNGTYLGGIKLLPGVPQVWLPDMTLRLSRYTVSLVKTPKQATPSAPVEREEPIEAAPVAEPVEDNLSATLPQQAQPTLAKPEPEPEPEPKPRPKPKPRPEPPKPAPQQRVDVKPARPRPVEVPAPPPVKRVEPVQAIRITENEDREKRNGVDNVAKSEKTRLDSCLFWAARVLLILFFLVLGVYIVMQVLGNL